MHFITKWKIKRALKHTDYDFAASVIGEEFGGGVIIKKDLAKLFDAFLAKPCLETALDIISCEPQFLVLFLECRPGGHYDVRRQVRAANEAHGQHST